MLQDYRDSLIWAMLAFSGYVVIFQKCIQAGAGQTGYLTGLFNVAAQANQEIQGVIRDCLQRKKVPFHQGTIWTTDAIYRETKGKVKQYQAQGVLGVEMELAALFAFGMARQVAIGGLLVVADELSTESWRPRFFSPRLIKGVRRARKAIVEIVQELV